MRRIDIIKRAGRNLRQSKGRTILTALSRVLSLNVCVLMYSIEA